MWKGEEKKISEIKVTKFNVILEGEPKILSDVERQEYKDENSETIKCNFYNLNETNLMLYLGKTKIYEEQLDLLDKVEIKTNNEWITIY